MTPEAERQLFPLLVCYNLWQFWFANNGRSVCYWYSISLHFQLYSFNTHVALLKKIYNYVMLTVSVMIVETVPLKQPPTGKIKQG